MTNRKETIIIRHKGIAMTDEIKQKFDMFQLKRQLELEYKIAQDFILVELIDFWEANHKN